MMEIIEKCKQIVVEIYNKFDASHDFAHIERVMKNAEEILVKSLQQMRKSSVLPFCCMISKMLNINQMTIHLCRKSYR